MIKKLLNKFLQVLSVMMNFININEAKVKNPSKLENKTKSLMKSKHPKFVQCFPLQNALLIVME
jgi:hypothetical protein